MDNKVAKAANNHMYRVMTSPSASTRVTSAMITQYEQGGASRKSLLMKWIQCDRDLEQISIQVMQDTWAWRLKCICIYIYIFVYLCIYIFIVAHVQNPML